MMVSQENIDKQSIGKVLVIGFGSPVKTDNSESENEIGIFDAFQKVARNLLKEKLRNLAIILVGPEGVKEVDGIDSDIKGKSSTYAAQYCLKTLPPDVCVYCYELAPQSDTSTLFPWRSAFKKAKVLNHHEAVKAIMEPIDTRGPFAEETIRKEWDKVMKSCLEHAEKVQKR